MTNLFIKVLHSAYGQAKQNGAFRHRYDFVTKKLVIDYHLPHNTHISPLVVNLSDGTCFIFTSESSTQVENEFERIIYSISRENK